MNRTATLNSRTTFFPYTTGMKNKKVDAGTVVSITSYSNGPRTVNTAELIIGGVGFAANLPAGAFTAN